MADIYVVDRLGPKQSLTEEGYLLCKDVALARTGVMIYGPWELKDDEGNFLKPGTDGVIYVTRSPEELFNANTMGSFEGKPVTINHPAVAGFMVTPDNSSDLTKGHVQNVHRGLGADDDILFADVLITNKEGIKKVRDRELVQISLGYNASYAQTTPGVAKQYDILGNHIALVVNGRCGERCAIGDSNMKTTTLDELTKVQLRQAFMTRDADAFENLMSEEKKPEEKKPEDKPEGDKPEGGEAPPFAKKDEPGMGGGSPAGGGEGKPPAPPPASPEGGTHHHIVINVHGQGSGGVPNAEGAGGGVDVKEQPGAAPDAPIPQIGPADEGGATRVGADPNNPGGAAGSMGDPNMEDDGDPVEMIMAAIKKIAARLTAVEQMLQGGQKPAQQPAPQPGATTQDDGAAGGTDMSGSIAVENKDGSKVEQNAGVAPSATKPDAEGPKGAEGAEVEKDMITKEDHGGEVKADADVPTQDDAPAGKEAGGEFGETAPQGGTDPGSMKMNPSGFGSADRIAKVGIALKPPPRQTKDDTLETPEGAPGPDLEKDMITKDDAQAPAGSPGAELAKGAGIRTRDRVRTKDGVVDARTAVRDREAWQNVMAMAEVISPGCKLPTFDAAITPADTKKNLCTFKRSVLDSAWGTASGNSVMRLFVGDEAPKINSMTCDAVDILFSASARALSRDHIMSAVQQGASSAQQAVTEAKVPTPAELNAQYAKFYQDKI